MLCLSLLYHALPIALPYLALALLYHTLPCLLFACLALRRFVLLFILSNRIKSLDLACSTEFIQYRNPIRRQKCDQDAIKTNLKLRRNNYKRTSVGDSEAELDNLRGCDWSQSHYQTSFINKSS